MTEIELSRVLFAVTAGVHFLFVATTLGLAPIIAALSTTSAFRPTWTSDVLLRVLGRVYLANYGIGIVTGLVMELQMAVLWTGPEATQYAPIASMLALETVLAFFLESILLGLWIAGAGILPRWVRTILFWGVTVTAYTSAALIVAANSYLHAPLPVSGSFSLEDVGDLVARPAAVVPVQHIATVSLVVGGFWLASIGARWLRGHGARSVARTALRAAAAIVAIAAPAAVISGVAQFPVVRPASGTANGAGAFGLALALMMAVGVLVTLVTWFVVLPLVMSNAVLTARWTWPLFSGGVAIPLATTFLGWLYREEARQPWFIVGRVTVEEAASPLPMHQLAGMSVVFVLIGVTASILGWNLIARVSMPNADEVCESIPSEALAGRK